MMTGRCSFRMPKAVKLDDVPYKERWIIGCACGTSVFGNSEEEAKATWLRHVGVEP